MIQTLNKNYETVIFIHGFQGGSLNKTMVHGMFDSTYPMGSAQLLEIF